MEMAYFFLSAKKESRQALLQVYSKSSSAELRKALNRPLCHNGCVLAQPRARENCIIKITGLWEK